MSIADRIAADHHTPAPWAGWCACEWIATSPDAAERPRQYAVHIAAVTEAAVRAQVAADIRAAGKAKGDPESDLQLGVRLGVDEAARIAEEGPRP